MDLKGVNYEDESCLELAGSGISNVESSGSATRMLVRTEMQFIKRYSLARRPVRGYIRR
jgi:hypothetical protein